MTMSMQPWQEIGTLVLAIQEDHQRRLETLERAQTEMKLELQRMILKYSFLGTVSAALAVLVPFAIAYLIKHWL